MKKYHVLLLLFLVSYIGFSQTLKSELDSMKYRFLQRADKQKIAVYEAGVDSVKQSGVLDRAIQKGEKAINFSLKNAAGKTITLDEQLKKGPVVLIWYRGGWCPYCNRTLSALQDQLPEFKKRDATLIALTPELPDSSLSTKEKNHLEFEILSDVGNKVALQYGVAFTLTKEVAESYNKNDRMLKYNGDTSFILPLAATYVIDTNGTVTYAFLDADYRNRAEPVDIIGALDRIKK